MQDLLDKIILYESESATLDFKEIQYSLQNNSRKNEILKDISAMANHPSDQDKFIVIGVIELNGVASEFRDVDHLVDEANYQQFVHSNIEPKINFEYRKFSHKGHQLAFFRIFNNVERPYLFKRDLGSPASSDRMDYKAGDGFIRIGTSTKKLTRDDLERIYSHRFAKKDRRGDLEVVPYIQKSGDDELTELGLDYVDIEIRNNSLKSIDFDVQMKIFKVQGLNIVSENVLLKKLEEQRHESERRNNPYGMILPTALGFSMDVSMTEDDNFFLVTRDKRRGERTALSISQHDNFRDVFCCNSIILTETAVVLKGEIIVRSDDFTEGVLTMPFHIDYVPRDRKDS